jgi:hypothetical protein
MAKKLKKPIDINKGGLKTLAKKMSRDLRGVNKRKPATSLPNKKKKK